MNTRKHLWLVCAVALVIGPGCWLGDRFGSGRIVSLTFLPPPGQTEATFSPNPSDLQAAVEVADGVLTDNRLERDVPGPLPQLKPGESIAYHFLTHGPATCNLSVGQAGVGVNFVELQTHSSQVVKKLCADIAKQLKLHFAQKKTRVKVTS